MSEINQLSKLAIALMHKCINNITKIFVDIKKTSYTLFWSVFEKALRLTVTDVCLFLVLVAPNFTSLVAKVRLG